MITFLTNTSPRLRLGFAILKRGVWHSLVIAGTALLVVHSAIADPGQWELTGNLNTGRYLHTATLLPNGRVLVVGGLISGGETASAELYDPVSGSWNSTGNLNTSREGHTASLLANGMVLVAGGSHNHTATTSAELLRSG